MSRIQEMGWRELLDHIEETATPEQMPYVTKLRGIIEVYLSPAAVHALDLSMLAVAQRKHLEDLHARLAEWHVSEDD